MNQNPTPAMVSGNCGGNAPANTIGGEGNFFFDEYNGNVWGPKTRGVWPSPPTTPGYPFQPLLTANRTYYVSTTGSDSNDGLTIDTPFATIQKAINVVYTLNFGGHTVTIQVAAGTYTLSSEIQIRGIPAGCNSAYNLIISGDPTTPSNVLIQSDGVTSSIALFHLYSARLTITGFKLISAGPGGNSNLLMAESGSFLITGPMEFGAAASWQVLVGDFSVYEPQGNLTVTDGAGAFIFAYGNSLVHNWFGVTITFVGVVSYYNATIYLDGGAVLYSYVTYAGTTPVGYQYIISLNAAYQSYGTGAPPGTLAGYTNTGGQFV